MKVLIQVNCSRTKSCFVCSKSGWASNITFAGEGSAFCPLVETAGAAHERNAGAGCVGTCEKLGNDALEEDEGADGGELRFVNARELVEQ